MAMISFGPTSTPTIGRRRINACSLPLHYIQLIAILVIIFLVLMNYLTLCVNIPTHPWQWLSIVLSSLIILPFLFVFLRLNYLDPAEDLVIEKSRGPRTDFDRQQHGRVITDLYCHVCAVHVSDKAKHCSSCNKCIYGFDHHCIWLNTCIGGKNYRLFLLMLSLVVAGTLMIFLNSLLQFIATFPSASSSLHLKPFYDSDRYAILMIPSSLVAFQVITAIIAFITLVTFGLTIYLLAFHIYLCKHGISTYDYVVQQRLDQTADQALSQFSQMQQNSQAALPKQSKLPFHRRKSNQINTVADNSSFKQIPNTHVFTVQGNHRDSPRRLQVCQSSNQEAYVLRGASQINDE